MFLLTRLGLQRTYFADRFRAFAAGLLVFFLLLSIGAAHAAGPTISKRAPELPQSNPMPDIGASYQANGSDIDLRRVVLMLDGVDMGGKTTISATDVRYTPPKPLSDGRHNVSLMVGDKAGSFGTANWSFLIDTKAPLISGQAPRDVSNAPSDATIGASFSDKGGSGVDAAKLLLLLDGVDVTAQATKSATAISYKGSTPLAAGAHKVTLKVPDLAGNIASEEWSFSVGAQEGVRITQKLPAEGAELAADSLPKISAVFEGGVGELDLAKTVLLVDGKNVTAQAQLSNTSISYTPSAALSEGAHAVQLSLSEKSGRVVEAAWNFITRSKPVVSAQTPYFTVLQSAAKPVISAAYSDVGAGIDPASIRLYFDGADVSAQAQLGATSFSYQVPAALADGEHKIKLVLADRAGNKLEENWSFVVATPPQITALTPKDVTLPANSKPVISANYSAGAGIDTGSVRLFVDKIDVTARAQVSESGISYTPSQGLASGAHNVRLEVASRARVIAQSGWGFLVDTAPSYQVNIVSPAPGQAVLNAKAEIVASASASKSYPSAFSVNGKAMSLTARGTGQLYAAELDLQPGPNAVTVEVKFADGHTATTSSEVEYQIAPVVTISSPQDRSTLGPAVDSSPRDLTGNVERPVTITGTTNYPMQSVTINQQQASLNGKEFRFDRFFLHEGVNLITVAATDTHGRVGTASVTVSVDQTAPFLALEAPLNNSITSSNSIAIRGTVNDAVEGYYAAPEPKVVISNGQQSVNASVGDKQFLASAVPLALGENTITVSATDEVGNVRSKQLKIMRVAAGSVRLTGYGGNGQSGAAGSALPAPLTVAVLDQNGTPLPNTAVTFDVMRGTGALGRTQAELGTPAAARNLVVQTNAEGLASVWLMLGKQSGPGSNAVHARAAGVAEDLTFIASGEKGPARHIRADLGINQYVATGTQPLEPLTAVVTDDNENRIANAAVTFSVVAGEARFENGQSSITVNSDKNGYAAVRPVLGKQPGMTIVKAAPAQGGESFFEATFTMQGLQPKDGPTRFSGMVMNDKGQPLPGARMSIGRTALSTTVDEKGRFAFDDIPPGKIDLFVDGRTVVLPGQQYPALHFEASAIQGAENQLPHPIYLPALEMAEARVVGGDKDVVLKMPGFEGYEMTVFANSVTFPDGSKTGPVVVSPISFDKLPMTPPGGYAGFMAPAATIQPSGTRFDPPVQLKIPNTAGLKPGEKKPVYQWDHDLATFVQMGQATVTEDGAFLITDAGTGISKAGWHPIPNPPPPDDCPNSGGAPKCDECSTMESSGGKCPKKSCKPLPPCKADPLTTTAMAEVPKGEYLTSQLSALMRKVPIISVAEITLEGKGQKKDGGECCGTPVCGKPKPFTEASGEGELKAELGFGPKFLNPPEIDTSLSWGPDRWHLVAKLQVSAVKFTVKGNGAAKQKTSQCNNIDCFSISGTASVNLNLADVKATGSLTLEEVVGRPSWNKWRVIMGAGAEGTFALKAGGIKTEYAMNSGGPDCGPPSPPPKTQWDEVALEGKFKVTAEIPGLTWLTGGYEWEYKYVIMEASDF